MAKQLLLLLIIPLFVFLGVASSYGGGFSPKEKVLITTQEHEAQSPEEETSEMGSSDEDPTDDDLDDYFVKEPLSVLLSFAVDSNRNEFDLPPSPFLEQQLRPPEHL